MEVNILFFVLRMFQKYIALCFMDISYLLSFSSFICLYFFVVIIVFYRRSRGCNKKKVVMLIKSTQNNTWKNTWFHYASD